MSVSIANHFVTSHATVTAYGGNAVSIQCDPGYGMAPSLANVSYGGSGGLSVATSPGQ